MPPKTKAPKIRWRGGGSRVDEELDAVDYADNYDDEYEAPVAKPEPKPAPKPPPAAQKPIEKPAPPKKLASYDEDFGKSNELRKKEQEPDPFEKDVVLETFDDWETAMDALDKKMSAEEEARAKQRQKK